MLLYFLQERLIFFPQPLPAATRARWGAAPGIEELEIRAADGVVLHGWLRRAGAGAGAAPLLIYFGGNAEEVSWLLGSLPGAGAGPGPDDRTPSSALAGWSVAALNYRGYGLSGGKPSERALFADAERQFDMLAARPDVDASRIVVLGRSLGSGVAVHLASVRPLRAVILVAAYDSIRAMARSHYPFLPVDLLLKHPFDSLGRAPGIEIPALFIAAGDDRIVEPERSRRLQAAWGGPASWVLLDGVGHNSIEAHPGYWGAIEAFLADLAPGAG